MDRLWAPWRVKYITELIGKDDGNVFVRIAKDKDDKKNYVFVRTEHCFSVLNIFPYNNGHTLVLPYRKVSDIDKLTAEESSDLFALVRYTKSLLDTVLKPAGYNIGINLGREAGAGFPEHLHFHIVPRWRGDVNFMPVTGQTKVISQSLLSLYRMLVKEHKRRQTLRSSGPAAGAKKKGAGAKRRGKKD